MPINTELIRWRIARVLRGRTPEIGQLVGYIDGRTAMDLLDELDVNWSVKHTPIISPDGGLIGVQADLTVDGVTRSDVGVPSNQDPVKGAYSDALKRAAVHFGVARELYELPQVYAPVTSVGRSAVPAAKPTFNEENGRWEIEPPGWVTYPDEDAPKPEPVKVVGLDKKEEIKTLARRLGMDKAALESFISKKGGYIYGYRDSADTLTNVLASPDAMEKLIADLTAKAVQQVTGGELE